MLRFFVFLLLIAVGGGGFYGGIRYQQSLASETAPAAKPSPDDRIATFEKKRAAVDADPQKWVAENLAIGTKPLESKDPEFLYLYGRALMHAGNDREAIQAFDLALANLRTESQTKLPLDAELKLAAAAAALRSKPKVPSQEATMAEQKAIRILDDILNLKGSGGQ